MPAGATLKGMSVTHLAQDELESLHLCDGEGLTQEEAGVCMGVSRGTVQRLLASARHKVAQAIVGQAALAISGVDTAAVSEKNSAPTMALFEKLKISAERQNEDGEFPVWLLTDVLGIVSKPEKYVDNAHLIELLISQIENYDPYAGAGCFDTSVNVDMIQDTIRQITLQHG